MPITLERGDAANIATEVQRWQFFLINKGILDNRRVDGDFGPKTEDATRRFQTTNGLPPTMRLDLATIAVARAQGYTVLEPAHYSDPVKQGDSWPPKPANPKSPSNTARNYDVSAMLARRLTAARERWMASQKLCCTEPRWAGLDLWGLCAAGGCEGREPLTGRE